MSDAAIEAPSERRRKYWRWSAYASGFFFLILLSQPPPDADDDAAYRLGYLGGSVAIMLGIAALIRLAYVKLRGDGRPVWSPWLFAIAVPLALVLKLGQLGDSAADE